MTVGVVHFLFVGAFLFAAGVFLVARRATLGAALAAVPLMLGGAGLDLAAVSRFTGAGAERFGGQEFAVVAAGVALAFVALGARLAATESER